jgi:hypothetical protein
MAVTTVVMRAVTMTVVAAMVTEEMAVVAGSVIGHGIIGKDIPIMAHLAKARRWSKQ